MHCSCNQRKVGEALVFSPKGDGKHRTLRRKQWLQLCNPGILPQRLQQFLEFRIQHLPHRFPPNPLQQAGRDLFPLLDKGPHPGWIEDQVEKIPRLWPRFQIDG
jgi:hypothetical protein